MKGYNFVLSGMKAEIGMRLPALQHLFSLGVWSVSSLCALPILLARKSPNG